MPHCALSEKMMYIFFNVILWWILHKQKTEELLLEAIIALLIHFIHIL